MKPNPVCRSGSGALRQRGITLLEVLIAMLLFVTAASALVLLINQAYIANAQSMRSFAATTTARSLLAVVEGNSAVLGSLDGLSLTSSNTSAGSGTMAPVSTWWASQVQQYPDLLALSVSTSPSPCSATAPCQITAAITVKSAFGGSVQRSFVLQDGF